MLKKNFKNCCTKCKKIPIKRYFLPLIGCLAFTGYEEFRNIIYFPILITLTSLIIFWNFPILAYMSASKPIYYKDMFIDEKKLPNYNVKSSIKKKFENIFIITIVITNSLLSGALSEYWLIQSKETNTYIEIIGMSGGIIKLFQLINDNIGRIMIKILKNCVKEENSRMRLEERKSIENIIQLKRVRLSHDELNKLEEERKTSRPRSETL